MRKNLLFLVSGLALCGLLLGGGARPLHADDILAHANLIDKQGLPVGHAEFTPRDHGVEIVVRVHDLPPGLHGIHVHNVGKADPPDFATAGGHFNPAGHHHGLDNLTGQHHAGDMPNLTVDSTGHGTLDYVLDGATLGPGPNSLLHEGGTSIVIHAGQDDEVSDPTGNSGGRIACGVIVRN